MLIEEEEPPDGPPPAPPRCHAPADAGTDAQEFLTQEGVPFTRRDYFKDRFTVDELRALLAGAGLRPGDVRSRRSRAYGRLIGGRAPGDDELLELMVREPTLLRRPLAVADHRTAVGFDRQAPAALIVG